MAQEKTINKDVSLREAISNGVTLCSCNPLDLVSPVHNKYFLHGLHFTNVSYLVVK